VLVLSSPLRKVQIQTGATGVAPGPGPGPRFDGGAVGAGDPSAGTVDLKRYDFILQFTWQPTTPGSKLPPPPQPAAGETVVQ